MYLYLELYLLCLHHWTQNQNIRAKRFLNFSFELNWASGNFLVQAMGPSVGICTPTTFIICLDSAIPFLTGLVTITAVPWWISLPFISSMRDHEQPHSYESVPKSHTHHTHMKDIHLRHFLKMAVYVLPTADKKWLGWNNSSIPIIWYTEILRVGVKLLIPF